MSSKRISTVSLGRICWENNNQISVHYAATGAFAVCRILGYDHVMSVVVPVINYTRTRGFKHKISLTF